VYVASPDGPARLVGTWTQGPIAVPFVLERGDPPGWADWAIYDSPLAPLTTERLEIYRRTFGVPALTAGARKAERVEVWSVGERRVGSGVAVTNRDQWRIGSMTKSMTATLVARLAERRLIGWDDTLGDVVGDLPSMRQEYRAATFRHLLTHRAGLPDNLTEPNWISSASIRPILARSAGPICNLASPSRR